MDWSENVNSIKEIYTGHHQIILGFATVDFLKFVLSDKYKYVWMCSHKTKDSLDWNTYDLPVFNNHDHYKVLARHVAFDCVMPTNNFKAILSKARHGITLIQLNELPKYYLNPATTREKIKYEILLKGCDYLFEISIPSATDYGTLVSFNRDFLRSLLGHEDIN